MATIADKILDYDVCAVRFEWNAVIAIVDIAILDNNIATPVCIPTICVFGNIGAHTGSTDGNIREYDIGTVRDEVIILRWKPQV